MAATGMFGDAKDFHGKEPFTGKPGMLRITAMVLFRDEQAMLDFAGTVRVGNGILHAVYHYDPQHAIVFRGAAMPIDINRLFLNAAEFPGITHFSAEVETVQRVENEEVPA